MFLILTKVYHSTISKEWKTNLWIRLRKVLVQHLLLSSDWFHFLQVIYLIVPTISKHSKSSDSLPIWSHFVLSQTAKGKLMRLDFTETTFQYSTAHTSRRWPFNSHCTLIASLYQDNVRSQDIKDTIPYTRQSQMTCIHLHAWPVLKHQTSCY